VRTAIARIVALLVLFGDRAVAQAPPYPPPGQMVDVGGHRVHLYCTGEGSPTVMVVGMGFSFDWSLVQDGVAKFTRICTYDASGTAWSDPGALVSCADRVNEVRALLKNASIPGPYIVAGLSVGALVARQFASSYPSEIAGVVIVDHAFIDLGGGPPSAPSGAPVLDSRPVIIEQTPIVMTVENSSTFSNLPERDQKLHRWATSLKPVLPTVETAEACQSQLRMTEQGAHPLGSTPLVVVSTLNRHSNYKKLQTELLALSNRSEQLIADQSFHSVEIDQPDVVVDAIRLVVDKARESRQVIRPAEQR
jgi:pimeloyl-ACP methyl ester carboxylesterase